MTTNKNAVHLRWNEFAIIRRYWRRYVNDDKITKTEIRHVDASDDDPFAEKRKKNIDSLYRRRLRIWLQNSSLY